MNSPRDVRLTIDARPATRVAAIVADMRVRLGKAPAVVLDPDTGRPAGERQLSVASGAVDAPASAKPTRRTRCSTGRDTALYPPGSTFKLVSPGRAARAGAAI